METNILGLWILGGQERMAFGEGKCFLFVRKVFRFDRCGVTATCRLVLTFSQPRSWEKQALLRWLWRWGGVAFPSTVCWCTLLSCRPWPIGSNVMQPRFEPFYCRGVAWIDSKLDLNAIWSEQAHRWQMSKSYEQLLCRLLSSAQHFTYLTTFIQSSIDWCI